MDELFEYKDDNKFMRDTIVLLITTFLSGCIMGASMIYAYARIFL